LNFKVKVIFCKWIKVHLIDDDDDDDDDDDERMNFNVA